METDPWVRKLKLPFQNLEEAKAELQRKTKELNRLRDAAFQLLANFRKAFPPGSSSIYLARSPDRSHTALRWRISPMIGKDVGRRRIELYSKEGLKLLKAMSPDTQEKWRRFEYQRIHLNYAFSITNYEVERLQTLVELYESWNKGSNP